MSKCDITIEFDRSDSTYRGGETVSGTAQVTVNKNLTSKGITLSHFWKTHGRGNTDGGSAHTEILASDAQLVAGETFNFPFSFEADLEPITYHGKLINIDHFVKIQVDVPWAIDPKLETEYILLPDKIPAPSNKDEEAKTTPKWLVVFILTLISPLILTISPILLPILIYNHIKKSMIAKRLGKVELETVAQTIGPGGDWTGTLRFTPKRDVPINGINARLICRETAVSGSGTNKTTYRKKVHDELESLEPEGLLLAGQPFEKELKVCLPEIEAYSFSGGSNHIRWSVEIRIDLPGIPDWKEEEYFEVIPVEFLDPASVKPIETSRQPAAAPVASPSAAPAPTASAPVTADAEPASPAAVAPIPTPVAPASPIVALLSQLNDPGNTGSERAQLIENLQGKSFPVTVDVERSVSTFTSQDGNQYKDGYTITGVIAGSEQAVEVFTLETSKSQVRDLRRGDQWSASVAIARWDTLYNRLVLLETG